MLAALAGLAGLHLFRLAWNGWAEWNDLAGLGWLGLAGLGWSGVVLVSVATRAGAGLVLELGWAGRCCSIAALD